MSATRQRKTQACGVDGQDGSASVAYAKGRCLKLREPIGSIVAAPRVKAGDPIHFEVRVRLAILTQPDPGRVSVAALVPREGIIQNHRHDETLFALSMVALSAWLVDQVDCTAVAGALIFNWRASLAREAEPGFWPTIAHMTLSDPRESHFHFRNLIGRKIISRPAAWNERPDLRLTSIGSDLTETIARKIIEIGAFDQALRERHSRLSEIAKVAIKKLDMA